MAELCPECQRGFYCGLCSIKPTSSGTEATTGLLAEEVYEDMDKVQRNSGRGTRRPKNDAALKDQQSTGRKRAAIAYPLDRDSPCEWGKATMETPMGGGEKPITFGCDKKQQSRHHGPNKNTLDNEPGNVHRICHWHHNNWHSLNDLNYDWSKHNSILKD